MATTETRTRSRSVGTSVPRKEDHKLVTGHGQFIDNINLSGQLWLSVVRSPYAHATIKNVDLKAARELEGVVVVTAEPRAAAVAGTAGAVVISDTEQAGQSPAAELGIAVSLDMSPA